MPRVDEFQIKIQKTLVNRETNLITYKYRKF